MIIPCKTLQWADQEHLITERHKFNIQTVDGKMMQSEFVVASPQQQQAIASFTVSSSQACLVLTGAAGTGKTLVALKMANNLIQSLEATAEPGKGPVRLVTTEVATKEYPLLKHLEANTAKAKTKIFDNWYEIKKEYGVAESEKQMQLLHLTEALAKRWEGRLIVILVDEIFFPEMLNGLADHAERIPHCVKLILILNPLGSSELRTTLPESFLHINLATPYRSTIAITTLARFLAKCEGEYFPEGEFGSDVEGKKPIVFDVGKDEVKLREALQRSRDLFGDDATLLYDDNNLPSSMREICKSNGKEKGGAWECYHAHKFFGWESNKVVAVVTGGAGYALEMATRAKTQLILILAESEVEAWKNFYAKYQKQFQAAADKGLVELSVSASANANV